MVRAETRERLSSSDGPTDNVRTTQLMEQKIDTIARFVSYIETDHNPLCHCRQLNTLEQRLNNDMANILSLLEQVTGSGGNMAAHNGTGEHKVQHEGAAASSSSQPLRPPKLARKLFPSSDSSCSPYDDDSWRQQLDPAAVETRECQESAAPIARLESLDELETSQVSILNHST